VEKIIRSIFRRGDSLVEGDGTVLHGREAGQGWLRLKDFKGGKEICEDVLALTVVDVDVVGADGKEVKHLDTGHWGEDTGSNELTGYARDTNTGDWMVKNDFHGTFIDEDPDRFRVRVKDVEADTNPMIRETIRVKVGTTSDPLHEVELLETDFASGEFESEWQLLTVEDLPDVDLDHQDDKFQVFSDRVGEVVGDEALDDRTHWVDLEGKVRVSYHPSGAQKAFQLEVPVCDSEVRELRVRFHVFKEPPGVDLNGDGEVSTVLGSEQEALDYVRQQLWFANLSWAQACIRVVQEGEVIFEDAPVDGEGRNIIADKVFSVFTPRDQPPGSDDASIVIQRAIEGGQVNYDVLEVYFTVPVRILGDKKADAAMIPPLANNEDNLDFDKDGTTDAHPIQVGENTFVFVGMYIQMVPLDVHLRTLAHEIGHALANDFDALNPPYILFPAKKTYDDYSITQRRRITHGTESVTRKVRNPGDYTPGSGNRLLRNPGR